ncbi:hypothetical protein [Micromonospora aurantiaca (nom. illeg.)]|uniref:hypothetical protein n=1 Tax=Micromonospora aurantiaca (nom. illeg.) TaxID=47850 RepID=UPI0033E89206
MARKKEPRVVLSWCDVEAAGEDLDEGPQDLLRELAEEYTSSDRAKGSGELPGPWFLRGLEVQGHVGIGEAPLALKLPPKPGIVVISAPNGTGKTSAADALRHLLSDGVARKYELAEANLHYEDRSIQAVVTNGQDDVKISCSGFGAARWQQPDGTAGPLPEGWKSAYAQFSPVLLYPEIAPVIEKPDRLHDFLKGGLPLDVLMELLKLVDGVRTEGRTAKGMVEREHSAAFGQLAKLSGAESLVSLVRASGPLPSPEQAAEIRALAAALPRAVRRPNLARIWVVDREAVERLKDALKAVHEARVAVVPGADAAREALEKLVRSKGEHLEHLRANDVCPVCGTTGAGWLPTARTAAERLTNELKALNTAERAADEQWRRLLSTAFPEPLPAETRELLRRKFSDDGEFIDRWEQLSSRVTGLKVHTASKEVLAELFEESEQVGKWYADVRGKIVSEYESAISGTALGGRQIEQWLDSVERQRRACVRGAAADKLGKAVELWIKDTRASLFKPIAEKVTEYWKELNRDSDLDLTELKLAGGTRQAGKVSISLAVGGTSVSPGPDAPKVLSTGQRNALALATYLPRATQMESPFRFLVLDDPIHAFDSERVQYLARALVALSESFQIVVLTHDERLWHELRALGKHTRHLRLARLSDPASTVQVVDVTSPGMGFVEELERVLAIEEKRPVGSEAARTILALTMCRQALDTEIGEWVEVLGRRAGWSGDRITAARDKANNTRKQLGLLNSILFELGAQPVDLQQFKWVIDTLSSAAHGRTPKAAGGGKRRQWVKQTKQMLQIIAQVEG